jgi:uncharacterized damage-inducible protein DinB
MNLPAFIAKQIRELHFGGNWTNVNLKDTLNGLTWQQSIAKIDHLNTIAALVYHINYFTVAVIKVLEGGPLTSSDKYSFDLPLIQSADEWDKLKIKNSDDAEHYAKLVEQLPAEKLEEIFTHEKYESYYKNIQGIIEHIHYHLGQMVLIKKMLLQLPKDECR